MTEAEITDIKYSLAKRVPAMRQGFVIPTNNGDIVLSGGAAEYIAGCVEIILREQLGAINED